MNKFILRGVVLAIAGVLGACSSVTYRQAHDERGRPMRGMGVLESTGNMLAPSTATVILNGRVVNTAQGQPLANAAVAAAGSAAIGAGIGAARPAVTLISASARQAQTSYNANANIAASSTRSCLVTFNC